MAAVWEQSRGLMAGRVTTIEDAVIGLLAGRSDLEARRDAERQAHKLAGSMGTFGRHRGSDLAREIEGLLQGSEPLAPDATLRLAELAVDLRGELERDEGRAPAVPAPGPGRGPEILVVDADQDFAHRVVEQALAGGLRATAVDNPVAARAAAEHNPVLVLVDPSVAGPGEEGLGLVAELSAAVPTSPVVVVADADAGFDRVTVSRAGGHSLLVKPVSPRALVDSVTRILGRLRSEATILVVDDDPTVAAFLHELLGTAGLHVEGVGDSRRMWPALDELRPDLLVLDLDMPDIDGLELCRMVRRDPVWSDLPVVFLTGTDDAEWVREMFSAGADDHVRKPMVAEDVVTRITNRLERSRALRSRADADSRSALATTAAFTSEVDRLLALARRQGTPLAVAVAELDGLAVVADGRHGRSVAAGALASASRLLSRSARPEDVVGWAGEQRLGIAMYGHEITAAVERLARFSEAVRAEAVVAGDGGPVRVTVSLGVAAFPRDGEGTAALLLAAGEALGRARDEGGDRVVATAGTEADRAGLVDVLVVDDDEAMGALLMHALATRGYRSEWIRDGAEAAGMLVDRKALGARVVLLDVGLPGLDGLSVLRRLGENGVLRSTRVIMLTLRSSDAEVVEALDLGAFDHVAKPFSLPVLLHRIRRALDAPPT